jgi:hypothetical protein
VLLELFRVIKPSSVVLTSGYLAKLEFSSNIEACVKIYHRHIVDISESRSSLTGG